MKNESKALDFTKDQHWGKGGRYIVNPLTGQREPAPPVVEDVAPPGEVIPAQSGERSDNSAPGVQIDGQWLSPFADREKPAAEADLKKPMKERNRA